ncbi:MULTISPECIES: tetratricopeptide repeat protein [Aliiruegeria]|uniref:Tetratricopeptide (TPR) repeat n=1 Tax=Aliiruegeria lutimaris TaxID=571298 RepID=A0A1G9FB31_9RHOB|nr:MULTISPECIES: hypothetical protein [Aliiruegeria]NDR55678.1 hypothetical protein [Pseudoruegeria sp. M32A2M]SDK85561.1 Tetratricopeptide (TPR) repeat [Aliiruegeria lutimaris]
MTNPDEQDVTPLESRYVTPESSVAMASLAEILDSPEFAGAVRVQAFLEYVVKESLEGRGDRIRGKTIVEDVYRRSPLEGRDPVAVVRVDAGRLRRRLEKYYDGSGAKAELQINFQPGSYEPRFTLRQEKALPREPQPEVAAPPPSPPPSRRVSAGLLASLAVTVIAAALFWWQTGFQADSPIDSVDAGTEAPPPGPGDATARAVRNALFSNSPARLQASNLAMKARSLQFPALEPKWQDAVLLMFELVIEMDGNYFAGYAGAAESKALIAVTRPPGKDRDGLLQEADDLALRALELGIDQSWSHSAAALVAHVKRDFKSARQQSDRATSLDPSDLHALNMDALISLFGGDFERAADMARRAAEIMEPRDYFPNKSIRASAEFHLGNYSEALGLITESVLEGDPISPISLGYLIAIHTKMGDANSAEEMLNLLESAWPGFPINALFRSLYRDPAHADEVITALLDSGWSGEGRRTSE